MRIAALALGLLALGVWQRPAFGEDTTPGPRREVIARGSAANEAESPPPGFHEEQRPRYGLIIGGTVTTVIGLLLLADASDQLAQAQRDDVDGSKAMTGELTGVIGILHLAAGVPLLAVGLLSPRDVYVRDRAASLAFTPLLTAGRVGGELALAF